MADLLPCPFCGDEAVHVMVAADGFDSTVKYYGRCDACFAQGPPCQTQARAIAAWNRRTAAWDDLMTILDQHWPEDVFPAGDDHTRDAGARIVGLLRWVDRLRGGAR